MTVVTNPPRTVDDGGVVLKPSPTPEATKKQPPHPSSLISPTENGLPKLYDDEKRSDVVFVAGVDGDTSRFPAHRRVLTTIKPVFSALLNDTSDIIRVNFVDRRGFEQLLRFQYQLPPELNTLSSARFTLDAAYKFVCPLLVEQCVRRIDEMLDVSVALEILRDLRFMCARLPGLPSAPPLPMYEQNDIAAKMQSLCSGWCDSLAHNALLVIDENADAALENELFYDLTYDVLTLIVKRDTLRVSSELVLAKALSRWSLSTCKKNKRELTSENKRTALGALAYCPRYLLLEDEQLLTALNLELLDTIEWSLVLARAQNLKLPIETTHEQETMLKTFANPRPDAPEEYPVHLSDRSKPPKESSLLCFRCSKRKKKKGVKSPSFFPTDDSDEKKNEKQSCCASFGDGLLRVLICMID